MKKLLLGLAFLSIGFIASADSTKETHVTVAGVTMSSDEYQNLEKTVIRGIMGHLALYLPILQMETILNEGKALQDEMQAAGISEAVRKSITEKILHKVELIEKMNIVQHKPALNVLFEALTGANYAQISEEKVIEYLSGFVEKLAIAVGSEPEFAQIRPYFNQNAVLNMRFHALMEAMSDTKYFEDQKEVFVSKGYSEEEFTKVVTAIAQEFDDRKRQAKIV